MGETGKMALRVGPRVQCVLDHNSFSVFVWCVFIFIFNNREKESQPEMRGSTQHNRLCVWMWYPCCLTAWMALHSNKRFLRFPLKRSHDKISIANINTQQAHWPIYTYAYTHLLLLLLTPPLLALPHLTPTQDTERWECGKVIFRTQAESLPEFDALAPDQHSTFEPVRPWGCLCPWWQFFKTFSCGSNSSEG